MCSLKRSVAMLYLGLACLWLILALCCFFGLTKTNSLMAILISKKMKIIPGSPLYESWSKPSVPIYLDIYFFNVTNPEEFKKGEKLHVKEIGPFVYQQKRDKVDVTFWNSDGKKWDNCNSEMPTEVSYKIKKAFTFLPEKSYADPKKTNITVVDYAYVTASVSVSSWFILSEFPLMSNSVHNILWNFKERVAGKKVGLLIEQTKPSAEMRVKTGVSGASDLGQFVSFGGKKKLDIWISEFANEIKGTDGTLYKAGLKEGQKLRFFIPSLCRSVYSTYQSKGPATNNPDVELYTFATDKYDMANETINPKNAGFCALGTATERKCPPDGLLDLSRCKSKDSVTPPMFASAPHFLGADPELRKKIIGLEKPDVSKHKTFIRMEPLTGLLLEARKRLQFNFFINGNDEIYKPEVKQAPIYFPLFWLQESVTADEAALAKLYGTIHKKKKILIMVICVIAVVFLLAHIVCVCCAVYIIYRYRKADIYVSANKKSPDIKWQPMNALYKEVVA